MLSYEICKKLKDAGFPQHLNIDECEFYGCWGDQPCQPTLSELIKACEDGFIDLVQLINNKWACNKYDVCLDCTPDGWDEYEALGSSPEEAVANLYLKLKS